MLLIIHGSDQINLTAEADPPIAGTDLAARLEGVITAAANLQVGNDFVPGIEALRAAIKEALPTLQATVIDEVDSAEDIVTELERSFMVSLILSMTAHTTTQKWVSDWESEREKSGAEEAGAGHYRSMRRDEPGLRQQPIRLVFPAVVLRERARSRPRANAASRRGDQLRCKRRSRRRSGDQAGGLLP